MRLSEFAERVGGRLDDAADDFEIRGISTLERAGEGELSFLTDRKYAAQAGESRASAIIVSEEIRLPGTATVSMREPWAGILFLLQHLYAHRGGVGLQSEVARHQSAVVDPTATIAADAFIGPHVVIGPRVTVGPRSIIGPLCVLGADCRVGADCLLHASVSVMSETEIGDRVILHPGVVLGADGFKYEVIGGRWTKIPQVGRVVIEDDVEIGANSCVDRASFTETRIGRNTKIDNLVQIAHNVQIGSNCVIVSQVGIAGSTRVGNGVIVAAQAGIADNLRIGNNVRVLARSGVKDNIEDGQTIIGAPARPFRQAAKIIAAEGQLPELVAEVNRLKTRVAELEARGK